ncbi:MAG TPA: choice-of-anchor tandem repeat NxxGxxAF-containing protein, partial [Phycisphaerales bacterium]|nr:choice-of-anchor tandem repeat NxxGxxAF-containing protein [Phycisphaerales bacterium]
LARETSLTPEIYPQPAWSESGIIAQSMSRKLTQGSQVTLAGDPAPGFASGILFKRFSQQPSVNAAGRTSFHATVGSNDTEVSWISVIYSDAGGSLAPVAFTGQSAPGTGGVFAELGREPAIDAASATFFWARVANMPASTQGIWRAHAATLAPMLLTGQTITAAPGPIASIARQIGLSASGAFTAVVSFAGSQGPVPAIVEVTPTGDARIIAMRGMQAPDAPPGVHYQVLGPSFISAEGQIAFHSILAGEGVGAGSQEAIYAVSPSGIPRLVARTGVSMEVDGLGSVTPIQLSFGSGGSFGGSVQFSGNATLAFRAIFASAGPGQNEALILAEIPCTADQDGSGFVDTDDFTYFVGLFEAGDPRADIDGSGFVDTDDFTAFVIAFEAGC